MARNVVDELVVRLTADATRLQAELGKAENQAKTGGQRIGASFAAAFKTAAQFGAVAVTTVTAVGTALTVAANKAAAYADEIDKASLRTRLSRGSVQELKFAADQLGGTFGDVETAVNGLTLRLAGAEQGSERQTEAFRRLGVATRDANGELRSTEDLFFETVAGLQGVTNETERAVLAQEVFGRSAASLAPILAAGAGSLEDVRRQARELGIVLSDQSIGALVAYKDQLSAVQQQFGSLGRDITTNFLPVLTQGLLPAVSQQVIPALRDLVERAVGVADAFDETGAPTQGFKDRIEEIAAAIGGLVTDLVALGEVSVGLVQVVTAPFAALGNVLGQLSVGVPNFLDAYRRAFSGDFSGFRGRPIDTLIPNVDDILGVALAQANAGLAGVRAGASRFGSFVPGAPGSSSFVPPTRTSGVTGVGGAGAGGVAGAPAGTTSDPVVVRLANPFGGDQRTGTFGGQRGDIVTDPSRQFVLAILDAETALNDYTNFLEGRAQAGRAVSVGTFRGGDPFTPVGDTRMFPGAFEGGLNPRFQQKLEEDALAAWVEANDAALVQAIASSRVVQTLDTRARIAALRTAELNEELDAAQGRLGDFGRALAAQFNAVNPFAGAARGVPSREFQSGRRDFVPTATGPRVPPMQFGDVFIPPAPPQATQDLIDGAAAARLAIEQGAQAQAAAALQTKQAIIQAGLSFATNLAAAIKSGSPSGIFGAITGGVGGIIGAVNPLAGAIFSTVGGLISGFLPDGREESEAARAVGAGARGAPAIELNLQVFQNLAVQNLTGGDRAAVDGLLDRTVERIETVLVSFGQRLTAVEARTA